jgi:hypothetical protein
MEHIHRIHQVGKSITQKCQLCGRVVRVREIKFLFMCEWCRRKEALAEIVKGAECK